MSNNPQQVSALSRQDFDLAGAMEFCQKIAAGEIKLEDLQAAYDAEDVAKEQAAIREMTERAKKFHARLDDMGLKYRDLLELEVLAHSLGDMGHNIMLGYERGEGWPSGPDSNSGPKVAYLDGQPVEIGNPLPEIAPDYSAGGATAEEADKAAERLAEIWGDMSITVEVAAEDLERVIYSIELALAIHTARIFKPELARRYLHTKKKRTRKKYEKRIAAWFREVLG